LQISIWIILDIMSKDTKEILHGAGPFYFKGNKLGVLMIHGGGGGTCADLKPLAEDLHQKGGYTVSLPLLPGYGTTPEDLKTTGIEDWKKFLNTQISNLMDNCDKIIIGGHSMGGLLTLILAANNSFDAIFTIGAPVGIANFLVYFVPFFSIFVKYHTIDSDQFKNDTKGKWVGYNKIPLNIAKKAKKLIKEMKEKLNEIRCPAIIFQGRLDTDIKMNSLDYIFANIKSKIKRKLWLENSYHPILDSPDHDHIVSELIYFIKENCP
jgi:carboxylesterase